MRRAFLGCCGSVLASALLLSLGCKPAANNGTTVQKPVISDEAAQADLKKLIDSQLEYTIDKRLLNAKDQAAWQVVHGALAFGPEFPLQVGDKKVNTIEYLLAGGALKGWNLVDGDKLDDNGRTGVKAVIEPGSLSGQGHVDQWLGYLSCCKLPLESPIVVQGKTHTLADYLAQAERDVHLNMGREYSWTLMALTTYHPTDYTWTAGDGSTWTVDQLVEVECGHDLLSSACGGMHRLSGLTMARNRRLADGLPLEGAWEKCDTLIKQSIAKVKEFQNADGTLSAKFLAAPGKSADLPSAMHASGHTLEFVILAADDEELKQPWITKAVERLCDLFVKTKPLDVECGALYHAAHGLVVYRERMYGPRSYLPETAAIAPVEPAPAEVATPEKKAAE